MRKLFKKLTADQKARGVIFSSTLSNHTIEHAEDTIHEVFKDDPNKYETIRNLKDIEFFKDSMWDYCIERK